MIELEENVKRKELEWQELIRAVARIHQLYLLLDPGWTMTETSQSISLKLGTVSMYLRVASELETNPRVAAASGIREAYSVLARQEGREAGTALESLLGIPLLPLQGQATVNGETSLGSTSDTAPGLLQPPLPVLEPIQALSFLDWGPSYAGPKFNLIHCDFPYGNETVGPALRGTEERFYDNDFDLYIALLETLLASLPRLASLSSHLMFWASSEILQPYSKYGQETWSRFTKLAPDLEFQKFPLIWIKSDDRGIASDPRRNPRHVYETCLLASLGSRQICRVVSDAYSAPTDRRLHPSTKPEPMLRHFFQMLVDETSSVLDPTAGSGAALRAADSLGARAVVGLEIDPEHCRVANQEFRLARMKRLANRELL